VTPTPRRTVRRVVLRATAVALVVPALGGHAVAHPGGGDSGVDHLIVEGVRCLVAAFLAYLVLSFATTVLYPKLRDYL